jgi:hypothetical protein
MPTIDIRTGALSVPTRRAIAIRLTRWLATRGVSPPHVVVRFTESMANSVFTGGMPVDALGAGSRGLTHATVICGIAPDRDDEFRQELSNEVAAALGFDVNTSFLYVEFRATRPDHVYVGSHAELCRTDLRTDLTGDHASDRPVRSHR